MSQLIYKKMSDVMKEIGHVGKDQKNQAQGFKFRGIDQFVNALYPALTRHGVFMTPRATSYSQEIKEVTRSNGKAGVDKHVSILMEYDFFAEDGSKVTVGPVPAEGLDSGDKATNKALSAALKYALIQTFSVPTEDMAEGDLETPEIGRKVKPTTSAAQEAPLANSPAPSTSLVAAATNGTLTEAGQSALATVTEVKKTSSFRRPPAKPAATSLAEDPAWD